jgi:hypothetical protein
MHVDVSFSFAKVYDVAKFDVVLGQKFSLLTDFVGTSNWFANNDPVLSLSVSANTADIEATGLGTSTILIMDESMAVIKTLTIRVVDAIIEPVKDLGLTADAPVRKDS